MIFIEECLTKIDFSVNGPFGNEGPKLKRQIEIAKLQKLNLKAYGKKNNLHLKSTAKKKVKKNKVVINTNYYDMKVPGS